MIRYALRCEKGDAFEAWFGAIADYDAQAARGLIACPHCGSHRIEKAPMAPAIVRGRRRGKTADPENAPKPEENDGEARKIAMAAAQDVRAHIRDHFDYVGDRFPSEARKMHDGEIDHRPIWGEATPDEAKAMAEEGLPVSPLPPELAPVPMSKVN